MRDHLAWAQAQFESGNAVLAGAIANHPQFNGMGLFCLGSPERLQAVMAETRLSPPGSTPTNSSNSSRVRARSSGYTAARGLKGETLILDGEAIAYNDWGDQNPAAHQRGDLRHLRLPEQAPAGDGRSSHRLDRKGKPAGAGRRA